MLTLPTIRRLAAARGMHVYQSRPGRGRPVIYSVRPSHWNGCSLQREAGDTTPEAGMLDGITGLRRWVRAQGWV